VGSSLSHNPVGLHSLFWGTAFLLIFLIFSLPRKTDLERKIEIYNFSARTRQLFVRLLALVKWANSASKVDKSAVSTTETNAYISVDKVSHVSKNFDLIWQVQWQLKPFIGIVGL
jgi:hypothetical protein